MKYIRSQRTNNKVDRGASLEFCGGVLEESGMEVFWRRCEGLSVLWWRKLDPVAFIRDTSGSKNTTENRQLTTTARLGAHRSGTQGEFNVYYCLPALFYRDMGKAGQIKTLPFKMNILVLDVPIIILVFKKLERLYYSSVDYYSSVWQTKPGSSLDWWYHVRQM